MNFIRRLMKICLFALMLVFSLLGLYHKKLIRVYNVIALFNPDVIVKNFRSMETMFETSAVGRGLFVHEFVRGIKDLPFTYDYKGKTKDIAKFLDDTWTTGLVVLNDGKVAFEKYYLGNTAASKTISW